MRPALKIAEVYNVRITQQICSFTCSVLKNQQAVNKIFCPCSKSFCLHSNSYIYRTLYAVLIDTGLLFKSCSSTKYLCYVATAMFTHTHTTTTYHHKGLLITEAAHTESMQLNISTL
jgi:hypothetical protein